ncbi:MAG: efflux RND transporter periplasmic adaptor subunit, partial [Candidatus Promineifilaceae bacterium]|nr:efflux RND transporter periplasmic adaptor subunit [Candidatus Promineifilaceae bacterium]
AISFTHEALVAAEEDLNIAQAKVDELKAGAKEGSLNAAAADISVAQANLEKARSDHEALLAGTEADQIASAEASLAQAQLNLVNLLESSTAQDIAIAEAELEQARLSLADAEEALAKATLTAPFDGVVTAVLISAGEQTAAEVIELVSDELKVVLSVDEIDVGALSPGQAAVITLETWPDREITGEIVSIAPKAGSEGNGVVTYDVQVNLEEPPDLPILVGMTANAKLIIEKKDNILLVPNAAITADREAGTFWVNLVTGNSEEGPKTEKVEVVIGLKDGEFTQIVSGLSAGDEVLIGEIAPPTQQFGPFGGG